MIVSAQKNKKIGKKKKNAKALRILKVSINRKQKGPWKQVAINPFNLSLYAMED